MSLSLKGEEVLQKSITLIPVELINPRSEALVDEETLESGGRVGTNDGVGSAEHIADVVRRSTRVGAKLEAVATRLLTEHLGVVGCGESREEGLHGGREGVVVGVGGGEEGVAAGRRKGVLLSRTNEVSFRRREGERRSRIAETHHAKERVVGRTRLERDVCR